jgi:hypothetical protein
MSAAPPARPLNLKERIEQAELERAAAVFGMTVDQLKNWEATQKPTRVELAAEALIAERLPSVTAAAKAVGKAMASSRRK